MLSLNRWAKWTLATVCISFLLPTNSATLRILFFFLLCFCCVFRNAYFNSFRRNLWWFLLIGSLPVLLIHGILEVKDLVVTICCICGISYLSCKFEFRPNMIILFLFFCILPVGFFHLLTDGGIRLIPVDGEYLNIIGGDTTKHGTALVGLMLLLAVLVYHYERLRGIAVPYQKKTLFCFFVFSLYLIIFSSRSVLLSALALLAYLYMNRKKFRPGLSVAFFLIANISVFFLEYLSNYMNAIQKVEWLSGLMRADNFGHDYGVTSGRAWLWNVHINAFLDSPYWMGGGRSVTDFRVNDWIPRLGETALAGSESAFTGTIACYGWVGISLILIYIGLFWEAVRRKNTMASAIMFCMIYNTTMGVTLMTCSGYSSIFCYFLYFTCLRKTTIYECK